MTPQGPAPVPGPGPGPRTTLEVPYHLWWVLHYSIALAYRIQSANRNRRACRCHACGTQLPTDHGHEVRRMTANPRFATWVYFCRDCFQWVREAKSATIVSRTGSHVFPDWWNLLDRTPYTREDRRRSLPRPQGPELDALIAEREPGREPKS